MKERTDLISNVGSLRKKVSNQILEKFEENEILMFIIQRIGLFCKFWSFSKKNLLFGLKLTHGPFASFALMLNIQFVNVVLTQGQLPFYV